MARVAAHRIIAMNLLLDALEAELGVLNRRLVKSGPKHYAIARFDALDHICQTCFIELESASTAVDSAEDQVLARVSALAEELDALASDYEELSDWAARPRKTRERTSRLIAEIKGGAGFSRDKRTAAPKKDSVGRLPREAALPEHVNAASSRVTVSHGDDAPLALSGVFARKRPSR